MSQSNENVQQIQHHRDAIDEIDKQLVALLNQRQTHAMAIRSLKPAANMGLFDARREEEIIERAQQYNEGPLYSDNVREIFTAILKVSKEVPE